MFVNLSLADAWFKRLSACQDVAAFRAATTVSKNDALMEISLAYQDMVDFVSLVSDPGTRERLDRAVAGRGAFRRFKDAMYDYPDLRQQWFTFKDRRTHRRAIDWLTGQGLISRTAADAASDSLGAEPTQVGPLGALAVAELAADRLRGLYGARLRRVMLYGSQARGDAAPEGAGSC